MRLQRREAGLWFCAIGGMILLGVFFWDALLAALAMAAI